MRIKMKNEALIKKKSKRANKDGLLPLYLPFSFLLSGGCQSILPDQRCITNCRPSAVL
jgi:hypothetical protein